MTRHQVVIAAVLLTGAAASFGEPPNPSPSSQAVVQKKARAAMTQFPNIRVVDLWLGSGHAGLYTRLDRTPKVGEVISLVCVVEVRGTPSAPWRAAMSIDGVNFCGIGDLQLWPPCDWQWQPSGSDDVAMFYIPTEAGRHTYRCATDVTGVVAETSELDNARQITFDVISPLSASPRQHLPVTAPPVGPQFRRFVRTRR